MNYTSKLAIMQWWTSLNPTQRLAAWQTGVIFILCSTIASMALAYNNLRLENNNEIQVYKAKVDQINENWILYLQQSIENDRELYLKTKILDERIENKTHENTGNIY